MSTLLVTGGAGFIGSNFIRYWLDKYPADRVINLDALTYAGNLESLSVVESNPNYQFVHANICDSEAVTAILESECVDTIVHFAAESHVDRSIASPADFIETNIVGTFRLLEAARTCWSNDRKCKFLHVSTDEVFGSLEPEDAAFNETTPYAPNSPYSASKASSDFLVRSYFHTYGFPVLTTNCSNNYGPYQFPEKLIPLIILNALEGKPLPVYGDGQNIRDWLHVEDHCSGIDAVINNGLFGETYNVGGCNEWKNIDIVRLICRLIDEKVPSNSPREELIEFVTDRKGHDRRYAIDATKMATEFGWSPSYSFEDGIVRTVQWYLENMRWCENVKTGKYREYLAH